MTEQRADRERVRDKRQSSAAELEAVVGGSVLSSTNSESQAIEFKQGNDYVVRRKP